MSLPEPFEFLDLASGSSAVIQVNAFQDGDGLIHPTAVSQRHIAIHMKQNGLTAPPAAGTPIGVVVPILRLFGVRLDEQSPANYFDVSSKTLRADLLARLSTNQSLPVTLRLTAYGERPRKRYSVEVY